METIAKAMRKLEVAVGRSSDFGVRTCESVTTSTADLRCSTEEGSWCTDADLPDVFGGGGSAPTPSVLLRAALGSCMAMSYRLRAARQGVELTSIRVTIQADSTIAGMLSYDAPAPPGYTEVRYHVEIESPAAPDVVAQIIDEGDRLSPLLDVFVRSNVMQRTTSIRSSER